MAGLRVWGKIDASRSGWVSAPLAANPLIRCWTPPDEGAPPMLQLAFPAGAALGPHRYASDCLCIVVEGSVSCAGEGTFSTRDLRWCEAGHYSGGITAGEQGVTLLFVATAGELTLEWGVEEQAAANARCKRVGFDDVAFVDFPDAAGRDTQPVQALFTDGPYLLRTRFVPDFVAGEHWHDFDTVYYVLAGAMQFGPQEPWYHPGDVRWVKGGHAYGPEQPGPEGVEFLLLSCGGPVSLRWADLETAPRGRIFPVRSD